MSRAWSAWGSGVRPQPGGLGVHMYQGSKKARVDAGFVNIGLDSLLRGLRSPSPEYFQLGVPLATSLV